MPTLFWSHTRLFVIGMDAFGRVLVVVYTLRGDEIRLISTRKVTRQERQQYEVRGGIVMEASLSASADLSL